MTTQRFIEFIEEIATDGDWEYANGDPMTEDAKAILAEIQRCCRVAFPLNGKQSLEVSNGKSNDNL